MYQDFLERKLRSVQGHRKYDLQTTQSQLLDIYSKLKQLDPHLNNLESKAVQSMQYHININDALTEVQSQMTQITEMMKHISTRCWKQHKTYPVTAGGDENLEPTSSPKTGSAFGTTGRQSFREHQEEEVEGTH